MSIIKPFLKWVGGKTQIIKEITSTFPDTMVNYHEPFLGGGSVLLAVLSLKQQGNLHISGDIYAYDLNKNIIDLFLNVQSNCHHVITEVKQIANLFNSLPNTSGNKKPKTYEEALQTQESMYYWIRSQYNTMSNEEKALPKGSAIMLFLNKTCFRGIYREGPRGFNVPYGHYKNPNIISDEHLIQVSELIKGVHFKHLPFEESLHFVSKGDFVFLDPPYAPEKETSFVGYTTQGFDLENHKLLFSMCDELIKQDIPIVMSNADVALVKDHFTNEYYSIQTINVRRAINSKKPQSTTNEVIIRSQPNDQGHQNMSHHSQTIGGYCAF